MMPLRAFLTILLVFSFFMLLTNCSINDNMFNTISTVYDIKEENIAIEKIPVEDVNGCRG